MIIHSLRARSWRGIVDSGPLELGEGFNLLVGPNGSGKSSLLEALVMTFFVKNTSKSAEMRSVEPLAGGGGPEMDVIFSVGNERWRVHKRFLKDSTSELWKELGGKWTHVANGDDADTRLREFFQAAGGGTQHIQPEHRGLAQALWSLQRDETLLPQKAWCSSLSTALSGTVQQVAQEPVYQAVAKRIGELHSQSWTAQGRVKKGSQQEGDEDKLTKLRGELAELRAREAKADEIRELLERIEIELTPLAGSLEAAHHEEEQARSEVAGCEAMKPQLDALEAQVRAAKQAVENLQAVQSSWLKALRTEERLASETQSKLDAEAAIKARVSLFEAEIKRNDLAIVATTQELDHAEAVVERLERVVHCVRLEQDLALAERSLESLRQAQESLRTAQAEQASHRAPKPKDLTEFRARRDELLRQEAEHRASAIHVSFALTQDLAITSDPPLTPTGDGTWLLSGPTTFKLGGLGTILVRGPESSVGELESSIRELRAKNQALLVTFGVDTEEALGQLLERSKELSREVKRRTEVVAGLSKTDTDSLAAEVVGLRSQARALRNQIESDTTLLPSDTTLVGGRASVRTLREQLKRDRQAQTVRQTSLAEARKTLTETQVALEGARAERRSLQASLNELVHRHGSLAQLEESLGMAGQTLEEQRGKSESLSQKVGPALAIAKAALVVAERRVYELDKRLRGLEDGRARAETQLEQILLQDVHESIANLELLEEQLARRLSRTLREAQAAQLLHKLAGALTTAQTQVLLGPISSRIAPWFERLTGGRYRDLTLGQTLLPSEVVQTQAGKELAFESLSQGTREQLAVLVRLAMGQILSERERQFVILDDRLVNSDALRFVRLRVILEEASRSCQILVASCTESDYAGIGGKVMRMGC